MLIDRLLISLNKTRTYGRGFQECALEMGQYRIYKYRYNIDMRSPKISTISIFDIVYCSALRPTDIFHYGLEGSH